MNYLCWNNKRYVIQYTQVGNTSSSYHVPSTTEHHQPITIYCRMANKSFSAVPGYKVNVDKGNYWRKKVKKNFLEGRYGRDGGKA